MSKRKLLSFFRKFLSSSGSIIILSLIALAFFIIGELRQIILFQGLAGVLGGTVLTLFVTNITGREAVSQQNAKEANITRKYTYYIPIFNELKQLQDCRLTHKFAVLFFRERNVSPASHQSRWSLPLERTLVAEFPCDTIESRSFCPFPRFSPVEGAMLSL